MVIDAVNTHYICRDCGGQFVESYSPKGYSDEIKERCLLMYVNGNGFRAIEGPTGVNHNTIINWVKKAAIPRTDAPDYSEIPEITQIDELQTFIGKKKQNMAVDRRKKAGSRNFSLGFRRPKRRDL
jgi:hypothetical protein